MDKLVYGKVYGEKGRVIFEDTKGNKVNFKDLQGAYHFVVDKTKDDIDFIPVSKTKLAEEVKEPKKKAKVDDKENKSND